MVKSNKLRFKGDKDINKHRVQHQKKVHVETKREKKKKLRQCEKESQVKKSIQELQQMHRNETNARDSVIDHEIVNNDGDPKDKGVPARKHGVGAILSSQQVVTGAGTQFIRDIKAGDVIVVYHPVSGKEEARIVTSVYSDSSLTIHKPFSSSLNTELEFMFLNKPKDTLEEKLATSLEKTRAEEMKRADETYYSADGGKTITYSQRKSGMNVSGGYETVKVKVDRELSREEQLDMRTKKKGDRYC